MPLPLTYSPLPPQRILVVVEERGALALPWPSTGGPESPTRSSIFLPTVGTLSMAQRPLAWAFAEEGGGKSGPSTWIATWCGHVAARNGEVSPCVADSGIDLSQRCSCDGIVVLREKKAVKSVVLRNRNLNVQFSDSLDTKVVGL